MKAMLLDGLMEIKSQSTPLTLEERPLPEPADHEVLIKVSVCGVCHTELDEIEDRTPPPELPVILGHQVVGTVIQLGEQVHSISVGTRVGVAWIYSACGECELCKTGKENLCTQFKATGRDAHGGYAEYMTVPAAFTYPIPDSLEDTQTAPLLCAGAIGYRSLRLTQLENGQRLGLTGFGASGHLVLLMVNHLYPDSEVYVFARNADQRAFAEELGANWSGPTEAQAPHKLHAIIDTTPAWKPIVEALENLRPAGRLVINAIRKEAGDQNYLQHLDYADHLWMEKEIKSVANITRKDVKEFLQIAAELDIQPEVQEYPLEEANRALRELKLGSSRGAKVLRIADPE
ncbi:MAG: zinc-dependent alcohol dehydrogenase family protein [Bacteroidota bacterium]